mmetsp:Transcript_118560/g.264759  ORF Transcript_118560/g.264759 Transcript_118560/m.264759 type:complete len:84 (+) Transcript_118560:110-361(+)
MLATISTMKMTVIMIISASSKATPGSSGMLKIAHMAPPNKAKHKLKETITLKDKLCTSLFACRRHATKTALLSLVEDDEICVA